MTTHYEVEDIPPNDVETQVALFEQANETVKDDVSVAERIRMDAEQVLGSIFHDADKAGNTSLANRVNDIWEQVQTLTTVAVRQGAALRGANGAISALKDQRDKVLAELKDITNAIENLDTDHEALSEFVETLEEGWEEDQSYYWEEYSFDLAHDNIREEIAQVLSDKASFGWREANRLFDLLTYKPDKLTDEQLDLLKQLGETLKEKGAADD